MTSKVDGGARGVLRVTRQGAAWLMLTVPALASGQSSGELSLGWREVWVDGDDAKYRQHVNLDDGPRLFDLGFTWTPDQAVQGAAPDEFSVRLADLGGDPYESISVSARRSGRYQARYRRHESEYFYQDILVLPENASVEGSTGGDFHHFDFRRTRDTASLELTLNERASVQLDFDRYGKRGDSTTVLDIEREEFELDRPLDETMEAVAAGFSYAWDRATLTVSERYSTFDYASSSFLPGLSEGSEPDEPTRLDFFFLDQPYELESWEHRIDLRARPTERLKVGVTLLAADLDVDLEAAERSQGVDFLDVPFSRNVQGQGRIDQDRELYDLSGGYELSDRVSVFGRLRLSRLEQSGGSDFDSVAESDWDIDNRRFEAGVEVAPATGLVMAAGWTTERREVDYRQADQRFDDGEDVDTDADGYFLRVSYRPVRQADLYLAVEDDSIDDPFTLASPTDSTRYRLRGRYRWDNGVSFSAGYLRSERDNDNSGWGADTDQIDLRVNYTRDDLSLSAGYSDVELSRSVDVLVIGGSAQRLFDIDYGADADFFDVAATWRPTPQLSVGGSARWYDNDGSFAVERDDVRLFLQGRLDEGYRWGVEYRRIDFEEGGIEEFDADVLELSLGLQW